MELKKHVCVSKKGAGIPSPAVPPRTANSDITERATELIRVDHDCTIGYTSRGSWDDEDGQRKSILPQGRDANGGVSIRKIPNLYMEWVTEISFVAATANPAASENPAEEDEMEFRSFYGLFLCLYHLISQYAHCLSSENTNTLSVVY